MTCFDFRYPNMFRVADAPGLDAFGRREAARVAAVICGRVPGLKCSYNATTGGLFFHYTEEPDSGPTEIPFGMDSGFHRYAAHQLDTVVTYINYGRIGRRLKDKIEAKNQQHEDWIKQEARERHKAECRPGARDYAAFLDKRRRGVGKVIASL